MFQRDPNNILPNSISSVLVSLDLHTLLFIRIHYPHHILSHKMSAAIRMPDMSGHVIDNGRYKLVESLGSGAYGVVYSAVDLGPCEALRDPSCDAPPNVAIKVLMKDGMNATAKMRVRREVLAHSMMSNHPNVITMRDAFDDKDYVYIILDYCPGGDLFTQVTDYKRYFRQDELLKSVFLQILDAVQACHRKRVYHRDLKPENILTTADGSKAWITDFGLATSNVFSETFHCGSSYYMSPGKHFTIIFLTSSS